MQILYLKSQIDHPATCYLLNIIRNVIRAQNNCEYVIDRIHGHLWSLSDNNELNDRCACELFRATDRWKIQWKDWSFSLDNNEKPEENIEDDREFFIRELVPKYFDNYQMRTNAFRTAIETAMNLHLTSVCL